MERIKSETYDKYIKAITDISQAITSDQYLEDILKLIVMVTAKVTGVEICSLWLIDEEEKPPKIRLKATQSIDPEYVKDRSLNLNEGVVGYVVTHKRPIAINDVLRNPRFKEREMARKLVERAKEILMHRRNLKGDEALRWLQKRSMDSRKPLRHIAEAVILSEDIALDRGSGSL